MATKDTRKADKSEKKQRGKPFEKGKSGNPSGRPKGSISAKTKMVQTKLEELDFDPITTMVEIAKDTNAPIAVRGKMATELASFVFPKRKAVEYSGNDGGPIQHEVGMRPPLTREEWEKKHGLDTPSRTPAGGD